jgi:hypothetical protein
MFFDQRAGFRIQQKDRRDQEVSAGKSGFADPQIVLKSHFKKPEI